MGWEDRNGNQYYYRKRRELHRVLSQYVGSGVTAQLTSILDRDEQEERRAERANWMQQKADILALDAHLELFGSTIRAIMVAALLVSGFHHHKGQWRKKRSVR